MIHTMYTFRRMVREESTNWLDKPSMLDQNGEPSGSSDPLLPLQTIAGFGCVQHTRLSPNDDRASPYVFRLGPSRRQRVGIPYVVPSSTVGVEDPPQIHHGQASRTKGHQMWRAPQGGFALQFEIRSPLL